MSIVKFKAIIFDLDGTLLETLMDLALAVNTVLIGRGFPEHPVDAYRYFIGDGIEMLVKRALPEGRAGDETVNRVVNEVREEYRRRWTDHTGPYPGVPELLDHLERRRIPKAIFSNKPHDLTVLTVDSLLARWGFAAVQGAAPDVPRKPDPAGILKIARQLRMAPPQIVYLGDSAIDMQAAVAAGMYPAGALWGFRDAAELREGGAKLLAERPQDVAELFE